VKCILIALAGLTGAILMADWFGVHVWNASGLGFSVHVYSFGATFALASLVAIWYFRRARGMAWARAIAAGMATGGGWWLATFVALFYFHGAIGGRY